MGEPTSKGLKARSPVKSLGQDAKCGRPTCPESKMEAGIHYDTRNEWFHWACGGVRRDISEPYCQYDKLS